jgi:hypothetical protein
MTIWCLAMTDHGAHYWFILVDKKKYTISSRQLMSLSKPIHHGVPGVKYIVPSEWTRAKRAARLEARTILIMLHAGAMLVSGEAKLPSCCHVRDP